MRRFALFAMLTLAACGSSPPTQYFTLTPVTPGTASAASATSTMFPLQVDAVHIPAVLDRTEMVRQSDTNGLSINDRNRWGAPLGEMARNVLARDLMQRLPQGAVILPDAPAPSTGSDLVVDIASFTEQADQTVKLVGSWTLMQGHPAKPILRRDFELQVKAAGGDPKSQAAAMSELLGRLADEIAATVTAQPRGTHRPPFSLRNRRIFARPGIVVSGIPRLRPE